MGSLFGNFSSSQNRLMDYADDEMQQPSSFAGAGTGGVNQGAYTNAMNFSGVGNGPQQTAIAQRPYQPGNFASVAQRQPPSPQYQPPVAQRQAPVAQDQPSVAQGVYRPQTSFARRQYGDRSSMLQRLWGN
jgi:hypothetical protein